MTDAERIAALERKVNELCSQNGLSPVTLPPEPPALVTEEMLDQTPTMREGRGIGLPRWWGLSLDQANALVEAAIRQAVERKTDGGHVRLDADGKHCAYIQYVSTRSLLALFCLDGGVP